MSKNRILAGLFASAVLLGVTGCTVNETPEVVPGSPTVIERNSSTTVPVPVPGPPTTTTTTSGGATGTTTHTTPSTTTTTG
jgi:hypothetical protein